MIKKIWHEDKTCIGIQNKKKLVVWNEVMRWRRKKKNIIKKMIVTRGHILGYFYPPALLAMFSVFSNFYGWRSESSNLRIKPCPTHAESRRKDVFDLNLEQSLIRILFSISKSYYFVGRKLLLFDGSWFGIMAGHSSLFETKILQLLRIFFQQ